MEEEEVLDYMSAIVSAVEYLHSKNIVHLNICPESLKLDYSMNIKLDCFSSAIKLDSIDAPFPNENQTPLYFRAPEFYKETSLTSKVDVWAVGILFYYICSFRLPYSGDTEGEFKRQLLSSHPVNLPLFPLKQDLLPKNNKTNQALHNKRAF